MMITATVAPPLRRHRSGRVALACAAAAALVSLVAPPAAEAATDSEWKMVRWTNNERSHHDLRRLWMSQKITLVARAHSRAMAEAGNIYHRSNLAAGMPDNWRYLGENVGVGPTLWKIHKALMNSPGHRRNILGRNFKAVGIGVVKQDGLWWVTQIFYGT
jgi:uncharacterized protein YkwD